MENAEQKETRLAIERAIAKIEMTHRKLVWALRTVDLQISLKNPFQAEAFWNGDNADFKVQGSMVRVNYRPMPMGPAHNRVPSEKIRVTVGQHKQPRFMTEKKKGLDFEKLAQMVVDEAKWAKARAEQAKLHERTMENARSHAERLNKDFGLTVGRRPFVDIDDSRALVLKMPHYMSSENIEHVLNLLKELDLIKTA